MYMSRNVNFQLVISHVFYQKTPLQIPFQNAYMYMLDCLILMKKFLNCVSASRQNQFWGDMFLQGGIRINPW